MKVQALQSFEHGGSRRRHAMFEVSDTTGDALAKKGLVKVVGQIADPDSAGQQPSAPKQSGRAKRAAADQ